MVMMRKGEDTTNDTSSGAWRREDSLDGDDIPPTNCVPPPSPPEHGGEREERRLRLQRSPPPVKKCRICFQTDILNERALAVGKGPVRSLETLLHGFKLWSWSRRRNVPATIIDDGFISPCACKGSMAWVHRQCLEEWRYKSARRDSFYSCEYCFVAYRFKHTWLAAFLNNPLTLLLMTLLVTGVTALAIVFLAGAIFPLRLVDWAEQLAVETTISDRANNVGDNRGIFGMDGVLMAMIPPTVTKYRRITRSDILVTTTTAPTAAAMAETHKDKTASKASTPDSKGYSAKVTASPTRTSRQTVLGGKRGDRSGSGGARTLAHSPVSYFNIAYWLTGHSMDEREEEQNDFLLAMMDVSTIKLWLVALAGLGLVALVRDFTAWSLLVALCLVLGLTGLYQSSPVNGINFLVLLFFPVPALLGIYRYVCWQYEGVESFMDVIIKNFSAELEDYQPPSPPSTLLSS